MSDDVFKQRVANLRLHGILAHWSQLATTDWLPQLVTTVGRNPHEAFALAFRN